MRDRRLPLDVLALFGLCSLGYLFWSLHLADPALTKNGTRFDPWLFRGGFLVTGAATLMIIAAVTHQRSFTGKALGNPLFNWIGTRSYGMYLYHWPIYQIIRKQAGLSLTLTQFITAMVITIPITEASYRYIEMPIRRGAIGNWLRSERRRPSRSAIVRRRSFAVLGVVFVGLLGWAGVSIATAPNRCVGVVECTLTDDDGDTAATEPPDTTTTTTSPDQSSTGGSAGSTSSTSSTSSTTTTIPVDERKPLAVGESVMLGARHQLATGGFVVDAAENRQADDMIDEITVLRDTNQIGRTIVIQAGTNGVVREEQYDAIMALLPAADVPQVVFMTVRAPKPWIDPNNELIRALPAKYPGQVTVLDWQVRAPEVEEDLSITADSGVHLRTERAMQFYADIVLEAIGHPELMVPV